MREKPGRTLSLAALVAATTILVACGSDEGDGNDLQSSLEQDGVFTGEASEEGDGQPPSGPEDAAELPKLSRAQVDQEQPAIRGSSQQTVAQWLNTVVNDVATFWQQSFGAANPPIKWAPVTYQIYTQTVPTGCSDIPEATAQDSPFYCPDDRTVYASVPYFQGFYGRIGDAALAVPIAHEIGHHIENQFGVLDQPDARSIDIELAADCLAGVWSQSLYRRNLLEPGDLNEALASRIAVQDPKGISPNDPQAHGTGAQRTAAFLRGYSLGLADVCFTKLAP